jgi:hypothetical protein
MKWRKPKKSARQLKQDLAAPGRFYGDNMTIHGNTALDVETYNGIVVSVWFRCQQIAFEQCEVGADRAAEMLAQFPVSPRITGIQVEDA